MYAFRTALLVAFAVSLSACPSRESVPNPTRYTDARVLDPGGPPTRVILFVGDGMGSEQIKAASHFRHGTADGLVMQSLPVHGQVSTASPSGITDSAAAATAMATGRVTWNGRVGIDQSGAPVPNLVELAKEYGMSTGLVSSTRITHATPASFAAHVPSRGQYQDIADHMAALRPDVLLGGGRADFSSRGDGRNISEELSDLGYTVVRNASELEAASAQSSPKLLGLFTDYHLTYEADRSDEPDEPRLSQLTIAALERLGDNPEGFFLLVEGGRIDHAGHANDLSRAVGETLEFDDAIAAAMEWIGERDDITVLITADHETGGLHVDAPGLPGQHSQVSWRWGSHTNSLVDVFAMGPGSEVFRDQIRDHRWIHNAIANRIQNRTTTPPRRIIPDGLLRDLLGPEVSAASPIANSDGTHLRRLVLDRDERGLAIGVAGHFPWSGGTTLVLIDVDYGEGTGIRNLAELSDFSGALDTRLSTANVPQAHPDMGIDLIFATQGLEPKYEQLPDVAGLRGLADPKDLEPLRCATNFSDNARVSGPGGASRADRGLELFILWEDLYKGATAPPANAELAIWVVQLDENGNATPQSLPAWSGPSQNRAPSPLRITF